jgi:drug/metabolite transporter (DMT)-like permease
MFLSERLSPREWLGVLLAVCGGVMLSYEKEPSLPVDPTTSTQVPFGE